VRKKLQGGKKGMAGEEEHHHRQGPGQGQSDPQEPYPNSEWGQQHQQDEQEPSNEWDIVGEKYEKIFRPRFIRLYNEMYIQLQKYMETVTNMELHVLDYACGVGEPTRTILQHLCTEEVRNPNISITLTACDSSKGMVSLAQKTLVTDNPISIPPTIHVTTSVFPSNNATISTFSSQFGLQDVILCSLGLMYMDDPVSILEEFGKALKPGGRVITSHWADPKVQSSLYQFLFDTVFMKRNIG
jgi:SAM-dependent methyltransferase